MANITKPVDINKIWASGGDILNPGDTKIATGWQVEIPPRQWFNFIDNRQDQAIAHINQHGVAVWDNQTEYQATQSYAQGSDGVVYKCLITNTNVNPVGDLSGSWRVAFQDASTAPVVATATQARALTDNTVFISPLQLANAFTGTNQSLTTNGFSKLPSGLTLQWGQATATLSAATVVFPRAFTTAVFFVGTQDQIVVGSTMSLFNVSNLSLTGFNAVNIATITRGNTAVGGTTSASCYWYAIGV